MSFCKYHELSLSLGYTDLQFGTINFPPRMRGVFKYYSTSFLSFRTTTSCFPKRNLYSSSSLWKGLSFWLRIRSIASRDIYQPAVKAYAEQWNIIQLVRSVLLVVVNPLQKKIIIITAFDIAGETTAAKKSTRWQKTAKY